MKKSKIRAFRCPHCSGIFRESDGLFFNSVLYPDDIPMLMCVNCILIEKRIIIALKKKPYKRVKK